MQDPQKVYTPEQVAEMLQLNKNTVYDLIGRGVLTEKHLVFVESETKLEKIVKPILHSNQYFHLLKYLKEKGAVTDIEIEKARQILQEEPYSGI